MTMKFFYDQRLIELRGDTDLTINMLTPPQLRRFLKHNEHASCFHIAVLTEAVPDEPSQLLDPQIQALIDHFGPLFQTPTSLPPARITDHHIHLFPQATPVNVRPYRYPHYQKQEIELQVESMLQKGLIRPSTSPFSSPVLLVRKHDQSWRFCVDYRALNAITIRDRFPIPTIDELLDELGHACWFSKLDLLQGYHQIRMHSSDIAKTAFRTHHGHYEFKVMPFGLCNAPSTFQATMNMLFRPFLRRFLIVFFDDILIYSITFTDHVLHLQQAFQVLLENQFVLKLSKCTFAQTEVEYLGHVVSQRGVEPVSSKVDVVRQWPLPQSAKALRSFLGLAGFYRRFIKGYATIAAPLVAATITEPFQWTPSAQEAFDQLKQALSEAPVLTLPDFQMPFTVETDASGIGMGAVLSQKGHPIAYFSKQFPPKLRHSSTYVRELFAVTSAVKRWRQYLLGHKFTIITDHRSLKELLTQVVQTPEQHTYLARLMGYDFQIQFRSGATNQAADALSRLSEEDSSLSLILSVPCLTFMEELRKQLAQNESYQSKLQDIQATPANFPDFSISNNLILRKGRIWLPPHLPLLPTLLTEYHATPTGGHLGVAKTIARLTDNFYWDGLRDDVARFVSTCLDCQHSKYETKRAAGLLCPLPIPHRPWEDLSLDFITGLPVFQGNTTILVVVDRFSKGIHLRMLPTSHTAYTAAALFMNIVGKIHGLPRSMISDRDPLFLSRFWQDLFRLSGTHLRMSSSYHPQSDGQTEALNRAIEQYLRAFVHRRPSSWGKLLLWVEWSHNTSWNVATGSTPYEITFGKKPFNYPAYLAGDSKIDVVDDMITNREDTFRLIRKKLLKAQELMKKYADAKRRHVEYQVGDWVMVKLRPHRQNSAKPSSSSSSDKLQKCFYGPFEITERIGPVAYCLKLPEGARIHPVFHCSILKPFKGSPPSADSVCLPDQFSHGQLIVSPLAILDYRYNSDNPDSPWEVLVQWEGLDPDETSWESWTQLSRDYHLEGKVNFQGPWDDRQRGVQQVIEVQQANPRQGTNNNTETQIEGRAKRIINKPSYLKDFV